MTDKTPEPGLLTFNLKFKSYEFANLELPIEIRKPNMGLVTRTLSSQKVKVAPGTYYVTATLPAGQEIISEVEVKSGEHKPVELKPDAEDESPHESHELQHFMVRSSGPAFKTILESMGPSSLPARIRVFTGNLLKGTLKEITKDRITPLAYPEDQMIQLHIDAENEPQFVQLLQSDKTPLNIAVPGWSRSAATMALTRLPDGSLAVDMHLQHRVADLLCHYRAQNQYEQVAITAGSPELDAERLLQMKMEDPIAAAVGAYSLLRIGALERLHDWTENLKNLFEWLPDGLTVRGEHLARTGNHDNALEAFLQLPSRGLPIFSDGLMYALDRLKYYVDLGVKEFDAASIMSADALVRRLQEFATYTDFGRPILTYTGLDPLKPDSTAIEDFLPEDGFDVSWFLN